MGQGRKRSALYLLSHKVGSVSGLHLEGTVLGPQIDRVGDAGAASLVDLVGTSALDSPADTKRNPAYHFGRLGTGDVELEVGILLPVTEEQRELEEEPVVRVAKSRQCLWTRVAIETAFEALAGADQFLPVLKVVRVGFLGTRCAVSRGGYISSRNVSSTYNVGVEVLDLGILLIGASEVSEVTHDCACRADEARLSSAVSGDRSAFAKTTESKAGAKARRLSVSPCVDTGKQIRAFQDGSLPVRQCAAGEKPSEVSGGWK